MDAKEKPFVAIDPKSGPTTSYGLFIDVDKGNLEEYLDSLPRARRRIEVAVRYNGVTKEFTFVDFFKRLGFDVEVPT